MDFIEIEKTSIEKETLAPADNPNKSPSITSKIRSNPWIIATLVLAILSFILILSFINPSNVSLSEKEAGDLLIQFFEMQGVNGLSVDSSTTLDEFYQINVSYQGQLVPFYITKSGYIVGNSLVNLKEETSKDNLGNVSENVSSQQNLKEVSLDDDAVKGNPDAPITIVEFSDFQCPFCGKFYSETLSQLEKEYVDTGKVKLVYRDFPLNFHQYAQKAAEAAECAGEFGDAKYWEMHNKLFENQDSLDVDSLKQYAIDIGIDSNQFNDCLDSGKMIDEVKADLEEGAKYGVSGTPAFFINGILLEGAQPFSEFKKIIDEELAKVV